MYKKLVLVFVAVCLASLALAKQGYYRWLDDNGQPHFTQNPPSDRPSQFIETRQGYRSDDGEINPEFPQTQPPKRADNPPPSAETRKFEILPDKDPDRCSQARNALASFSRGQRVRVTDEDGNSRLLNAEEQAAQKEEARKLVDIYC